MKTHTLQSYWPWIFLGYGIHVLLNDTARLMFGLEGLGFVAGALVLLRGSGAVTPVLGLALLGLGSLCGLLDTLQILLDVSTFRSVFELWPYLAIESLGVLLALTAFQESSAWAHRVLEKLRLRFDHRIFSTGFGEVTSNAQKEVARQALKLTLVLTAFHAALFSGVLVSTGWASEFVGAPGASTLFDWTMPAVFSLLFEDALFLVACLAVRRQAPFGRPLLMVLAAVHFAGWGLVVLSFLNLSLYSLAAFFFFAWSVMDLAPVSKPDVETELGGAGEEQAGVSQPAGPEWIPAQSKSEKMPTQEGPKTPQPLEAVQSETPVSHPEG